MLVAAVLVGVVGEGEAKAPGGPRPSFCRALVLQMRSVVLATGGREENATWIWGLEETNWRKEAEWCALIAVSRASLR